MYLTSGTNSFEPSVTTAGESSHCANPAAPLMLTMTFRGADMASSANEMTRFERALLGVAFVLAGLLILARVASIIGLTFLHHLH